MAFPEREWDSISWLAKEWMISEELVEHYLETRKLVASIKLPITMLSLMDIESGYDEDKEEHIDEPDDPELYEGLFDIDNYNRIVWNSDSLCDFEKNRIRLFRIEDDYRSDFEFPGSYEIRKNEILIRKESIDKFITTYCDNELSTPIGLTPLEQPQLTKSIPPYLDSEHEYFSQEIETAVSAWTNIYHNKDGLKKYISHKNQIMSWIEKNRQREYGLSGEAINRITTMVNHDKRNKPRMT